MTTTTSLTLDEFLRLPETEPASEHADGEVQQKPIPTQVHAELRAYLLSLLRTHGLPAKHGRAWPECRCIFG